MRAHYLQHVPFEGLGSIKPWLEDAGYKITSSSLFTSDIDFPDLRKLDLLIAMGGPMSVNDEDKYPWLIAEKKFIREAVHSGKPVLGICLGAQLIASAAGARVYRNPFKEIGWFPIYGVPSNDNALFSFSSEIEVFHWHGETFDLPAGAVRLAKSDACANQAFQFGKSVVGLQFHLETTPSAMFDLVAHCRDELVPSEYVQTEEEILAAGAKKYKLINMIMGNLLSFLLGKDS